MADNEIIRSLERKREEDPDGFSSDVLNYINSLKAEIQQLQLSTMVCEQRELIIENAKLITLNWGNPLVVAIKSEAIREFAEELTDRIVHNNEIVNRDSWVITSVINNLVKETMDATMQNNTVIVPPCKVGDTVYMIYWDDGIEPFIEEDKIIEVSTQRFWLKYCYFNYDDIGKTVFLTREEAEMALKERTEVDDV